MTGVAEARLADALRRTSFREFARGAFQVMAPGEALLWNWHLDAICHQLELVRAGIVKRLIIEVPPRSLKSFLASVAFPAFCLGRDPAAQIIAASYSLDLATKLHNDCRALIRSSWYRALFPHSASPWLKDTETELMTGERGLRYATSTGGTLTGRGGNLVIIDDPMRSDDAMSESRRTQVQEWYRNTVPTRINDKLNGAIVLVMQRLHIDDLAGHLRDQPGWTVLSLPAIAQVAESIAIGPDRSHRRTPGDLLHPAREPQQVLDDLQATLGSYHFSAQYQQEPVPVEGQLVKWAWFKQFDQLPDRDQRIVQSWDVAVKAEQINDWSVCTTWAVFQDRYYLLNVFRKRLLFPELYQAVINQSREWKADSIVIEDKQTGSALIQQLREKVLVGVPRPIAYVPTLDKVSRMSAESATIEQGHVFIQTNAAWQPELKKELAQFPNGRFDDQVDSISQFLNWVRTHRAPTIGFARTH